MSFLVSKTFDIIKPTASQRYNFYAPDETVNEDALIYKREQYTDIIKYQFIKSDLEAEFASRYIKLNWEKINSNKEINVYDSIIRDIIYTTNDYKDVSYWLNSVNINSQTERYYEYHIETGVGSKRYEEKKSNKGIVVGKEALLGNDLITDKSTEAVFASFIATIDPTLEYTSDLNKKYEDSDNRSGYVGYVIVKEKYDSKNKRYNPHSFIVVAGGESNVYYDYKVSYGVEYRYRIASLYKHVTSQTPDSSNKNVSITVNGKTLTFNKNRQKPKYDKKYYVGCFSEWSSSTVKDTEPPSYPEDIRIIPDKESTKKFILLWGNVQQFSKDIKKYYVWRRLNKDYSPWEIVNEQNDNKHCIETIEREEPENFKNHGYIYAIQSEDVHGNKGLLSRQILVQMRLVGYRYYFNIESYLPAGSPIETLSKEPSYNDKLLYLNSGLNNIQIMPGANFDPKTSIQIKIVSDTGDYKIYDINPKITIKRPNNTMVFQGQKATQKRLLKDITPPAGRLVLDEETLKYFAQKAEEEKQKAKEKETSQEEPKGLGKV